MAIYRLLQKSALGPEEIAVLPTLTNTSCANSAWNDPVTELIAKKVIELSQRGVRDSEQLLELAIKELGVE